MPRAERLIVVKSDTPEKFQEEFNAVMDKYKDCKPKYEFVHSLGHCAYITYIPPDDKIQSKYQFKTCGTCGNAEKPLSDRVKWRKCNLFGSVNCNAKACDRYFPEVEYGN